MFIQRTLGSHLAELGSTFRIVYVGGARQVGKSTLLRQALPNATYVSLDDPEIRNLAIDEPRVFLARYKAPLIIDEAQYAPSLFPYLKMAVETNQEAGQYWLSGSQPFHLLKNVSESLAGRVGIVDLLGLSTREIVNDANGLPILEWLEGRPERKALDLGDVFERIWRGSFPALHATPGLAPEAFYASYMRTYLERDVRDLARVGDERAFLTFTKLTASRTGQLLNINELANASDISHATSKAWLSVLEASGLVLLLAPFHANADKRLIKSPKLYFLDTGLAAWLSGWTTPRALENGTSAGAYLETYVVGEVLKSYWHQGQRPSLYFYRDRDDHEVDLVVVKGDTLWPLEVKLTSRPDGRTARQLQIASKFNLIQGHGV